MSWLKEVFDFSNENKDPFTKLLLRLTFLVVFFVLLFFAYNIITGKCVEIAGCRFCVINKDTTKAIINTPVIKPDTNKRISDIKKTDSTKHDTSLTIPIKDTNTAQTKPVEHHSTPPVIHQTKVTSEDSESDILTLHDKNKIEKILNEFLGDNKGTVPIFINYDDGYKGVAECAFELKAYLTSQGFYVKRMKSIASNSNSGFGVTVPNFILTYSSNQNEMVVIQIGQLSENDADRTFQIETH